MRTSSFLIGLLISCTISSCSRQLNPSEYTAFVQDYDNGLKRQIEVNNWIYDFQYKPSKFILLQENISVNDSAYQRRLADLNNTAWFNITFKKNGSAVSPLKYEVSSLQEYEERYHYYISDASSDIYLIYGLDTLMPISYHFETSYGLAPQETMVVGFSLPEEGSSFEDMQINLFDRIFDNGIIKASFNKNDLNNIPDLIN